MIEGLFTPMHLLLILVVFVLLFGAKRLPELGKSLGSGIREFKKSTQELRTSLDADADETPATPALNAAAAPEPGPGAGNTSTTNVSAPTPNS